MKKYFLISSFIFMSLISCGGKEKNTKLLRYTEQYGAENSISEINTIKNVSKTIYVPNDIGEKFIDYDHIKSVEYLQLDTNEKCLISEINKLFFLGDNIVVVDDLQHKVFLFSNTGKFITQIGKIGKGPNEYIKLTDVFVDYHKNRIVIYDNVTQKLFYFSEKGDFVKNENIYLFASDMALLLDKTLLMHTYKDHNQQVPDIMNYQLITYDVDEDNPKKKILGKGLSYSNPFYDDKLYIANDGSFNVMKNYVLFTPLYTNDVYKIINQKSISLKYHIDLGKNDWLNNLKNYKSLDEMLSALNDEKKWRFNAFNLEAGDYLFSTITNAGFFFYNNKNGQLIYGNGLRLVNKSQEKEEILTIDIYKTLTVRENDFVSVCYPSELPRDRDKEEMDMKYKNLKKVVHYSDNPILIFYSL